MFAKSLSLIGLLAIWPGSIQAHDIYSRLVNDFGESCCDARHCRPAHYRLSATAVQMFVYGQWVTVPADKIQYRMLPDDTGETGGGHWCGANYDTSLGEFYVTRCAVLPPHAAALGDANP